MKEYQAKRPILVVGGSARAFLGEYMAGGLVIVLGVDGVTPVSERGVGSGIHGGEIIVRGRIDPTCLGGGAEQKKVTNDQKKAIRPILEDFARAFTIDPEPILAADYSRIIPASGRPFANMYTWE
jgi:glutamate synthase domain-containing protein 3